MDGKTANKIPHGNHGIASFPDDEQYRQIAAEVFERTVQEHSHGDVIRGAGIVGRPVRKRKQELSEHSSTYTWKAKKKKPDILGRCLICYSIILDGDLTNAQRNQKPAALMDLVNFQARGCASTERFDGIDDSGVALGEAISELSQSPYNCLCEICHSTCEEISSKQQIIRKLEQEILELQRKSFQAIKLSLAAAANEEEESTFLKQTKENTSIECHLQTVRTVRKLVLDGEKVNAAKSPDEKNLNVEVKSEMESDDESLIDWESSDSPEKINDSVNAHSNPLNIELPINDSLGEKESKCRPEVSPGCDQDPLPKTFDDIAECPENQSPPSPISSRSSGSLFQVEGAMSSNESTSSDEDDDEKDNLSQTEKLEEDESASKEPKSKSKPSQKAGPRKTSSKTVNSAKKKNGWYDKQTCDICGKILANKQNLRLHKEGVHEKTRPHVCELCGKTFTVKTNLLAHIKRHTGKQRKYNCHICSETFLNRYPFETHMLRKHNETVSSKIYECGVCKKKFVSKSTFQDHEKIHQPDGRQFKCEYCGKMFHQRSNLKIHERKHTGACPYECDLCSESFSQLHPIKQHRIDRHSEELSMEALECVDCKKSFFSNYLLRKHRRRCHETGEFACEKCGYTFQTEAGLQLHMKRSCGKKGPMAGAFTEMEGKLYYRGTEVRKTIDNKYACPFASCESTSRDKNCLRSHIRNCHSETPRAKNKDHQCHQCGKGFASAKTLLEHIKGIHEGGFSCDICGVTKTSQRAIAEHKQVEHEGNLPHVCEHCGKAYLKKCLLTIHLRHHTGERPYVCNVCGNTFIRCDNLTEHQRTHHLGIPRNKKKTARVKKAEDYA